MISEVLARKDFLEEGCCVRKSQKRIKNSAGILGGARASRHDPLHTAFPKRYEYKV